MDQYVAVCRHTERPVRAAFTSIVGASSCLFHLRTMPRLNMWRYAETLQRSVRALMRSYIVYFVLLFLICHAGRHIMKCAYTLLYYQFLFLLFIIVYYLFYCFCFCCLLLFINCCSQNRFRQKNTRCKTYCLLWFTSFC